MKYINETRIDFNPQARRKRKWERCFPEMRDWFNSRTQQQCKAINDAQIGLYEERSLGFSQSIDTPEMRFIRQLPPEKLRALIVFQDNKDHTTDVELNAARDCLYNISLNLDDDEV